MEHTKKSIVFVCFPEPGRDGHWSESAMAFCIYMFVWGILYIKNKQSPRQNIVVFLGTNSLRET